MHCRITGFDGAILMAKTNEIRTILDLFKDKRDQWQGNYDDRCCNEPEYPSAIDRWQSALDCLQDKIDEVSDLIDELEYWVDSLAAYEEDENKFSRMKEALQEIYNGFRNFSRHNRGVTPILKRMKKFVDSFNVYTM